MLLSVYSDFSQFTGRDRGHLLAWVFAIAENRVRDLARHFGAAKRASEDEGATARDLARAQNGARGFSETSPSEAAGRAEALERMHRALGKLPEVQQTILRLRDLQSLAYEEIVATMGLASVGAARTLRLPCPDRVEGRHGRRRGTGMTQQDDVLRFDLRPEVRREAHLHPEQDPRAQPLEQVAQGSGIPGERHTQEACGFALRHAPERTRTARRRDRDGVGASQSARSFHLHHQGRGAERRVTPRGPVTHAGERRLSSGGRA